MTVNNNKSIHKGVIIQQCADRMRRTGEPDNLATYAKPVLDLLYALADGIIEVTDAAYPTMPPLDRFDRARLHARVILEGVRAIHYGSENEIDQEER